MTAPQKNAWFGSAFRAWRTCALLLVLGFAAGLSASCGESARLAGALDECGVCGDNGTCTDGQCVCDEGFVLQDAAPRCVQPACVPRTCAAAGATCGGIDDGCGGTLVCGDCGENGACTDGACKCNPGYIVDANADPRCVEDLRCTAEACVARGFSCGLINEDGCSEPIQCGTCASNEQCVQGRCGPEAIQVFALVGQSNMVGFGTLEGSTPFAPGTMSALATVHRGRFLRDGVIDEAGQFLSRDDVWVRWDSGQNLFETDFGPGLGSNNQRFGPEYGFGHTVGEAIDSPVAIIKAAWGGRSLREHFRPPSSGPLDVAGSFDCPLRGNPQTGIGACYRATVQTIKDGLAAVAARHPGRPIRLAAIGWHQGWNDRINTDAVNEYGTNLVNLINDMRRELAALDGQDGRYVVAADVPFIIATTGMGGFDIEPRYQRAIDLIETQLAVANDARVVGGNVASFDTRSFWRTGDVSPSPTQDYHWHQNAETYWRIGRSMALHALSMSELGPDDLLEDVYVGQTHLRSAFEDDIKLVGNRKVLVKVDLASVDGASADRVVRVFARTNDGAERALDLEPPIVLEQGLSATLSPRVLHHDCRSAYCGVLPAEWMTPGPLALRVSVGRPGAPAEIRTLQPITVGAPTKVEMTMFDVHYFEYEGDRDYADGWERELLEKWPAAELEVQRVRPIIFEQLVVPARADVGAPPTFVRSRAEYQQKNGLPFDGEQAAALQWIDALRRAGGQVRLALYYLNIANVPAGGQAGGYSGVGRLGADGILHHELGHALSLPHWDIGHPTYPHFGNMFGVARDPNDSEAAHIGPTWGVDLTESCATTACLLSPIVQPNTISQDPARVGQWKWDPMMGGGTGDQEPGYVFRTFSDFSVRQMHDYAERHVVVWDAARERYVSWNDSTFVYNRIVQPSTTQLPIVRDVSVISLMASTSSVVADVNLVYPPIGPYRSGLIERFDPRDAAQVERARTSFCPSGSCDYSLRVRQGGVTSVYLLPLRALPDVELTARNASQTAAVNVPAADGTVTRVELLLTPRNGEGIDIETATVLNTWQPG